eukprot:3747420-Pyramimonas_sp.AAC.1
MRRPPSAAEGGGIRAGGQGRGSASNMLIVTIVVGGQRPSVDMASQGTPARMRSLVGYYA